MKNFNRMEKLKEFYSRNTYILTLKCFSEQYTVVALPHTFPSSRRVILKESESVSHSVVSSSL